MIELQPFQTLSLLLPHKFFAHGLQPANQSIQFATRVRERPTKEAGKNWKVEARDLDATKKRRMIYPPS